MCESGHSNSLQNCQFFSVTTSSAEQSSAKASRMMRCCLCSESGVTTGVFCGSVGTITTSPGGAGHKPYLVCPESGQNPRNIDEGRQLKSGIKTLSHGGQHVVFGRFCHFSRNLASQGYRDGSILSFGEE